MGNFVVKFMQIVIAIYFSFFSIEFAISNQLKVVFLNVGEGESIFIQTPNFYSYLIDVGNPITGFNVVSFLRKEGVNKLSGLIITHHHLDHIGGVFYVLQTIEVESKFDNGEILPDKGLCGDFYRWYKMAFRHNNYQNIRGGKTWQIDNVYFEILWPFNLSGNFNEDSLVIKLSYGKYSFLLIGDISKEVEKKLIRLYNKKLRSNVLKVAHHGAHDATSKELLELVSPQYAVISINKNNIRGYPSREVIKLLKSYKIKTFFTFRDGTIIFSTDGKNLQVKTGYQPCFSQ